MLESLTVDELTKIRAHYQEPANFRQHDKLENQAVRDIRRLLDHITALEREMANLRAFKEEAIAWGRALDEGWSARR
jgi:iron uptake system EfeUOB component EfeO/EfeM